MDTEFITGAALALSGLILLSAGVWLLRRFDKQANDSGLGRPSIPVAGLFYLLGTLLAMSGGFLLVFATAMLLP